MQNDPVTGPQSAGVPEDFVGPVLYRCCAKCNKSLPLHLFKRNAACAFRRAKACRTCSATYVRGWCSSNRDKARASSQKWRATNPDKVKSKNQRYKSTNPDRLNAYNERYRAANIEKARVRDQRRRTANLDAHRARDRKWAKDNPDKARAKGSRRRARLACPPWADHSAILDIYKLARRETRRQGRPLAVDHIYPLQGRTCSGLHVAANLRPICATQNLGKGNKLPGHLAHELWDPTGPDVYHGSQA